MSPYRKQPLTILVAALHLLLRVPRFYGCVVTSLYLYLCRVFIRSSDAIEGMIVASVRHTDQSSNFIDAAGKVRHEFADLAFEDPKRADQVEVCACVECIRNVTNSYLLAT